MHIQPLEPRQHFAFGGAQADFGDGGAFVPSNIGNDPLQSALPAYDGGILAASHRRIMYITQQGNLRPSFATGGVLQLEVGLTSLGSDDTGRIYALTNDAAIRRFTPRGKVDTSFGNRGKVNIDFVSGFTPKALAVGSNGSFEVAGSTHTPSDSMLLRFNADGTPLLINVTCPQFLYHLL